MKKLVNQEPLTISATFEKLKSLGDHKEAAAAGTIAYLLGFIDGRIGREEFLRLIGDLRSEGIDHPTISIYLANVATAGTPS